MIAVRRLVESSLFQRFIITLIIFNAIVLGLETDAGIMEKTGRFLIAIDKFCLVVFCIEIVLKVIAYRWRFFRDPWNWFDLIVVGIALIPGGGPWSVLRGLRVLRVFRLLGALPQLRKVVAAFAHAIPGLGGVILLMAVFFYTMAVLATNLFGDVFPDWFGSVGKSLYSLFQVMTLESWSMGIARPVMESFPWAWAFFVPFIMVATFTILNLFIGVIVSTMQELSLIPDVVEEIEEDLQLRETLDRMEKDLSYLRQQMDAKGSSPK